MATSLYVKLHKAYGAEEDAAELQDRAIGKARRLSDTIWKSLRRDGAVGRRPRTEKFKAGQRVVVVGAGFAGLSAAYFLMKSGAKVILVDGGNHLGGRVQTLGDFIPGRLIEAGAELIGLNHPLWITLARQLGLSLSPVTSELSYVAGQLPMPVLGPAPSPDPRPWLSVITDRLITTEEQRDLYSNIDQAYVFLNEYARKVDPYRPWACEVQFPFATVKDWIDQLVFVPKTRKEKNTDLRFEKKYQEMARHILAIELENDQGVPVSKQSFLGLLAAVSGGALSPLTQKSPSEYWRHSEHYRCTNGNQTLALALFNACEEMSKRGQDEFVYMPGRFACLFTSGETYITVSIPESKMLEFPAYPTATNIGGDGKANAASHPEENEVTADWLVWATPEPQRYQPEFPAPADPQMGRALKVLMHCKKRFWLDGKRRAAPSAFHTELGSFWESTDNQASKLFDFSSPNSPKLVEGGVGLTLFSGGSLADNVLDLYVDQRGKFNDAAERIFPGLGEQLLAPPPVLAVTKKSGTEGLTCDPKEQPHWLPGGYSCPAEGEIESNTNYYARRHLHRTVFAGEHTHPCLFGFMEGALQSGLRAAMLVTGQKIDPYDEPSGGDAEAPSEST